MSERDAAPDGVYTSAVTDVESSSQPSEAEPSAVGSNSSNYGGSARADKPLEDRVLHPPEPT